MESIKKIKQMQDQNRQPVARAFALRRPAMGCCACLKNKNAERGQQVLEYAILIAAFSVALVAMTVYAKRGLQGMIKDSADQIASQADSQQPVVTLNQIASISNLTELTSDTEHVRKIGDERAYDFESASSSSGNAVTVTQDY